MHYAFNLCCLGEHVQGCYRHEPEPLLQLAEVTRELLAAFEGRRDDYTPRNAYEQNYFAGTPARIDQVRAPLAIPFAGCAMRSGR